jgi:RHH-type proline utilization regulon transcriptional repressor/proline dehydrogenase/delta 1-pyrroline-5-carboxylate dehydrogenase
LAGGLHGKPAAAAEAWCEWLASQAMSGAASRCKHYAAHGGVGAELLLAGPTGERNVYSIRPRGVVLCMAETVFGACLQIGAALATGNEARVQSTPALRQALATLPSPLQAHIAWTDAWRADHFDAVLFEGSANALREVHAEVARRDGAIVGVQGMASDALEFGRDDYRLERLVKELSVSTNTAAAGGNASLMSIG